ncbi:hypothetical protein QAD02_017623 [Eretmocerus hayati]|uniref:Uncharacterized protein n=1 Tax=Eretmocerus hayati TaxID=131215 RepID=A0ACC2PEE7_9HYME|nr:hypothetical protein QAD02_017623 [Eretmocerus hayati]
MCGFRFSTSVPVSINVRNHLYLFAFLPRSRSSVNLVRSLNPIEPFASSCKIFQKVNSLTSRAPTCGRDIRPGDGNMDKSGAQRRPYAPSSEAENQRGLHGLREA